MGRKTGTQQVTRRDPLLAPRTLQDRWLPRFQRPSPSELKVEVKVRTNSRSACAACLSRVGIGPYMGRRHRDSDQSRHAINTFSPGRQRRRVLNRGQNKAGPSGRCSREASLPMQYCSHPCATLALYYGLRLMTLTHLFECTLQGQRSSVCVALPYQHAKCWSSMARCLV